MPRNGCQLTCRRPIDTTIYALSHLGHSTKDVKSSWTAAGAAGLREQVDHKVTFLDELKERGEIGREGQRLVLMGHSIGSWVCCEVRARIAYGRSLALH